MRKALLMLLIFAMLLVCAAPALADGAAVNLTINGKPTQPPAPPYIQNSYTMVPLRFISENCGMLVDWDAILRRVTVIGESNTIRLDIGDALAYVNGEPVQMQVPAVIKDGYTMVPLRFIMENLDAAVEWDAATRTVALTLDIPLQRDPLETQQTAELPQPQAETAPPAVTVTEPAPASAGRISGYYFDSASWDMLSAHSGDFDTVINFAYKVFADGSVDAKNYNSGWDANAYPLLTEQGIEKLLLVTDFDAPQNGKEEGSPKMLANTATRAQAVDNIAALVRQTGADGVDIDFEKLNTASRDNFTAFIRELKAALEGRLLTVSVKPRRNDRETWLDMYDYAALGLAADRLHVMFYDQHYGGSEPGPVAAPAWMREGLDYMLQLVPREKLHVMLGAYGRAWGGSYRGSSIHISRAREIIDEFSAQLLRDEASGVPYLLYQDKDGNPMQLWFEDAVSMGQKAALAREYGVGGIGVWRMGIVPDDVWQSIVDNFRE